jgi:hypothetical protein
VNSWAIAGERRLAVAELGTTVNEGDPAPDEMGLQRGLAERIEP